jgi:hypothetical protein
MMDFEVLKTKDGHAMQVEGKFYAVPHKYRTLNRVKLMTVFKKEPFTPLVVQKPKWL